MEISFSNANSKKNKLSSLLLALLIYAPTLVLAPQAFIYIIIAFIGLVTWMFTMNRRGLVKKDLFFIFFIVLSFLIYFVGKPYAISDDSKSLNDYVPYSVFIIATIGFSNLVHREVIKYLLFFILLETVIGVVQYIIGVPYFIKPISTGMQEFGESELLYYNKVYGFSPVTSIFALKIFVGFLLLHFYKLPFKLGIMLYFVLCMGLIATFNRTAILSSMFFVAILVFINIKNYNINVKILALFALIGIVFIIINNFDYIENQFFRGKDMDLSGRDFVFPYYLGFIAEHPFFGNYFTKHWVDFGGGRVYHAHNSYLQTFANMGLIIGILLFLLFISKINKKNYLYIIPILLYSSFQYGILWGVSFLDILFFAFLFNFNNEQITKKV